MAVVLCVLPGCMVWGIPDPSEDTWVTIAVGLEAPQTYWVDGEWTLQLNEDMCTVLRTGDDNDMSCTEPEEAGWFIPTANELGIFGLVYWGAASEWIDFELKHEGESLFSWGMSLEEACELEGSSCPYGVEILLDLEQQGTE